MALLNIIKAGHPVLKEISQPVDKITKEIKRLLDDMAETMYDQEGVGLAAPQVNVSVRIVVLDDGSGLIELINPVITACSGSVVGTEGCLSVPGLYGEVERYSDITVEALNRKGRPIRYEVNGFLARIFQHEIDHLNGELFIEKTTSLHKVEL